MNKKYTLAIILVFLLLITGCNNKFDISNIPVLLYHSVKPELTDTDNQSMVVSTENFEKDLMYLNEKGYNTISLLELAEAYENPKIKLPKKPILITFDDGYIDNYHYAYPLLKKYNSKASIFTIVWSVGRDRFILNDNPINPHFTWEQGKEMIDSGLIELGSHTFDMHSPEGISYGYENPCGLGLSQIEGESEEDYYNRILEDIQKSKEIMEENLGVEVNSLAYPYGLYNETVIKVLDELGFKLGFITDSDEPSKSNFEIRRFSIRNDLRVSDVLDESK